MAAEMLRARGKNLIGRFVGTTPITLFRIQGGNSVRLRLEATAKAAGRTAYDIDAVDGKVFPRDPAEVRFLGPNGMSMRPKGNMLAVIIGGFRGPKANIFEIPKGTPIPPELVLLHEHSDHYSVQPAKEMTTTQLNSALTAFLTQPGTFKLDKEGFYERHPDMHPHEVGFSNNA